MVSINIVYEQLRARGGPCPRQALADGANKTEGHSLQHPGLTHTHSHTHSGYIVRLFCAETSNTPTLWRCVHTYTQSHIRLGEYALCLSHAE